MMAIARATPPPPKDHFGGNLFAPRALAGAAEAEAASRDAALLKRREAGEPLADAARAELEVWSDIADWAAGRPRAFLSPWPAMTAAAARALAHLDRLAAARPGDTALRDRRDAVAILHDRLTLAAAFCDLRGARWQTLLAAAPIGAPS